MGGTESPSIEQGRPMIRAAAFGRDTIIVGISRFRRITSSADQAARKRGTASAVLAAHDMIGTSGGFDSVPAVVLRNHLAAHAVVSVTGEYSSTVGPVWRGIFKSSREAWAGPALPDVSDSCPGMAAAARGPTF